MEDFLRLLFIGIATGCIYGLLGLGLVVIFNTTGVINLAQGEFLMVGGILAYWLISVKGISYPLAIPLIVIAAIMVGLAVNWLIVKPLLSGGAALILIVIGTYSTAVLIAGTAGALTQYAYVGVRPLLPIEQFKLGFWPIVPQYGLAIITAVIFCVLYWFFLTKTHIGWALRAVAINADVCKLLGISTARMIGLAFALSAAICAIAGVIMGPVSHIVATMGFPLMIKGFIAAALGGMGNPFAAVLGGIIIGVAQILISGYAAPGYAELVIFCILILTLIVRPHGLLPAKE
jgi:branched-chain amino acid transport system permease protein